MNMPDLTESSVDQGPHTHTERVAKKPDLLAGNTLGIIDRKPFAGLQIRSRVAGRQGPGLSISLFDFQVWPDVLPGEGEIISGLKLNIYKAAPQNQLTLHWRQRKKAIVR